MGVMGKIICYRCGADMGEREIEVPPGQEPVTHGLCPPCFKADMIALTLRLRDRLPGRRIRLESPKPPLQADAEGTIDHVDDQGNVHVDWDQGIRLALTPGDDLFHFL